MIRTLAVVALLFGACDRTEPVGVPTTAAPHADHVVDHHAHHHEALAAAEVVPGTSLYQLDVALEAYDGRPRTWEDFRGQPLVVSMVYTTCTTACPLIVAEIKRTLEAANAPQAAVLLVSFDPSRDDPAALRAMKARHELPDNWVLARTDVEGVAQLAAALGIRYRQLPNLDFNHSQVVSVLDAEGSVVARAEGLAQQDTVVGALTNLIGDGGERVGR